jgi:ribosomal protein S4E
MNNAFTSYLSGSSRAFVLCVMLCIVSFQSYSQCACPLASNCGPCTGGLTSLTVQYDPGVLLGCVVAVDGLGNGLSSGLLTANTITFYADDTDRTVPFAGGKVIVTAKAVLCIIQVAQVEIITDCSVPIYQGKSYQDGDFLIMGGASVGTVPVPLCCTPPGISGDNSVCASEQNVVYSTPAVAGHTFSWSVAGGSIDGSSTGNSVVIDWGAAGPGTLTATETITADNCFVATSAYNVTVNPNPVLSSTLTPGAICSGDTFTYTATSATSGSTFSWTRAAVAGISQGASTGVTGSISETLTNTTTAPINVTYVITTTANSCPTPQNVVVTVNPDPILSSTLTPGAICSGDTFTYTATSATSGSTFSWTRAAVAGISQGASSGAIGSINEILTNTTTAPVNVTYIITTTANSCPTSQNVVVTVNPDPVLSSTLTPGAICSGDTFTYTATSATSGSTFSWTRAAVAGISQGASSGAIGSINEILTNTTTAPVNVTYEITTTANGCPTPQNVVVTVNPDPVLSSTLTPGAICSGDTFTYTATSATSGSTFSWTRAAVAGISESASSGVTGSINEILTNTTTAPINVTYVITTTANSCPTSQNVLQ